jgi:hypothetical protein
MIKWFVLNLFKVYSGAIWLNLLPRDDCRFFFYIFLWMIATLATNKNSLKNNTGRDKALVHKSCAIRPPFVQRQHKDVQHNNYASTYVRRVIFVHGLANGYISL